MGYFMHGNPINTGRDEATPFWTGKAHSADIGRSRNDESRFSLVQNRGVSRRSQVLPDELL